MTSITDNFLTCLYELSHEVFPHSVILQAKKCFLDYLGVTFAGAKILKDKGNVFLDYFDAPDNRVSVMGFRKKSDIYNAALINGMSAHIAELDDGSRYGSIHPGAPIISSLLPLAQLYRINGINFLRGLITGYEAAIRLADAIQPSHRNMGYHATGTCGTIGVAIGVCAALGLSKKQMHAAVSAAATCASGILHVTKASSELKPFNAGQAAVSGLIAAFIARAGFNGSDDVLAGKLGFMDMMAEHCDLSKLYRDNNDKLAVEKVYIKPYAACRHCHPAIEAALEIKKKYNIKPEHISEVKVSTYRLAADGHEHTQISGITSAKMSTPYSVAVALKTGKAGIDEFSENKIKDHDILKLTKKIIVISDDNLSTLVPHKRPAIVEITTCENEKYSFRIDLAKGEPENPLMDTEIFDKFFSLSLFAGKSLEKANIIAKHVWNIDREMEKFTNFEQLYDS